jgi:hypothetical protein
MLLPRVRHARVMVLLLAVVVSCWPSPRPAHAASAAVTAFYTTNKTAYDQWDGSVPPPRQARFPAGTTNVYYYVEFAGAAPGQTKLQVLLHNADGRTSYGRIHIAAHASAAYISYFSCPLVCKSGNYQYDLLVYTPARLAPSRLAATTRFVIARGFAATSFHTIRVTDFQASLTATRFVAFARAGDFSVTTPFIPFELTYGGAVPNRTRWQVVVHTGSGAVFLHYPSKPVPFTYTIGWLTNALNYLPSWPPDTYRLDLEVDGRVVGSTEATVHPTASGICPATKAVPPRPEKSQGERRLGKRRTRAWAG